MGDVAALANVPERSLLIVDDDKSFVQRLARAMESRGFAVTTAEAVSEGLQHVERSDRKSTRLNSSHRL